MLAVAGDPLAIGEPFRRLRLRALATGERVTLSLFGDGHLAPNLLHVVALGRDESQQLGTLRFRRGAVAVCGLARLLGIAGVRLDVRQRFAQLGNARLEARQLVMPCLHLARRQAQVDDESALGELGVAFGALALPCQRTHLRLHLRNQVVETLQVDPRFREPPLGRPPPVAV